VRGILYVVVDGTRTMVKIPLSETELEADE
jgi:hypothetical protein